MNDDQHEAKTQRMDDGIPTKFRPVSAERLAQGRSQHIERCRDCTKVWTDGVGWSLDLCEHHQREAFETGAQYLLAELRRVAPNGPGLEVPYESGFEPAAPPMLRGQQLPDGQSAKVDAPYVVRLVQEFPWVLPLLEQWAELFRLKHREYGEATALYELGVRGQYVDMSRKMRKLHNHWWEGQPLATEQADEILRDFIGHCFLALRALEMGIRE